jgi:hypothetical protein
MRLGARWKKDPGLLLPLSQRRIAEHKESLKRFLARQNRHLLAVLLG